MKLILDTLEAARLTASPADAMDLADALADLEGLAAAMRRNGWSLCDAGALLDDLRTIRDHVAAQPFDTSDDEPLVTELSPGSFAEWLAILESLAQ